MRAANILLAVLPLVPPGAEGVPPAITWVSDPVFVHCVIRNADAGITVKPTARCVLLRDNRFVNVARPRVRPTATQ
jgi:hypothetical protein